MLRQRALFLLCILSALAGQQVLAQGRNAVKIQNLQNFDLHRFHFGFLLGYNTSDFIMTQKARSPFTDSVLVIDHVKQPGFNLGIVASLNMTPNLSLRFIPSLSFQDRNLMYYFRQSNGEIATYLKPVESTYLDFPLLLKVRSDRINNFAVYVIGGGKFSIDMATKKDVNNNIDEDIVVKLKKYDYSGEAGGGFDMFLPYFKFGIELKAAFGFPNVFLDDDTRFSRPLGSIRTKAWMLTFTFEG